MFSQGWLGKVWKNNVEQLLGAFSAGYYAMDFPYVSLYIQSLLFSVVILVHHFLF